MNVVKGPSERNDTKGRPVFPRATGGEGRSAYPPLVIHPIIRVRKLERRLSVSEPVYRVDSFTKKTNL